MSIDPKVSPSFDNRSTLSRSEAREVYDGFASTSLPSKNNDIDEKEGEAIGGNDVESGYGGPAVTALCDMAIFSHAKRVFEYGTGQGKLAALVLGGCGGDDGDGNNDSRPVTQNVVDLQWFGVDQSPLMVDGFRKRCVERFGRDRCSVELLENGDPAELMDRYPQHTFDRFVSTYVLDLLSEEDMYKVIDLAEMILDPTNGKLLLAGITWGYRNGTIQTFAMTAVWEILYQVWRKKVGGCRPQTLEPYLKVRGWAIEKTVTTLPDGYPWMMSEVICARPPPPSSPSN
jgi:SAM-dependent methyltransferase